MTLARRIFLGAGIYGLVLLLPQYFMEERLGRDFPPPVTHPEYYYGFLGVALAWQVLFLAIARDPVRLRPAMPVAALEKFAFGLAVLVLHFQGRVPALAVFFAAIDLLLGSLFLVAYGRTRSPGPG